MPTRCVRLPNPNRDGAGQRWCVTRGASRVSRIGRPDLRSGTRASYGSLRRTVISLVTNVLEFSAHSIRVCQQRLTVERASVETNESRLRVAPHGVLTGRQRRGRLRECPFSCAKPCATHRVSTGIVTYLRVGCTRWTCTFTWENADLRLRVRGPTDQFKSPSGHPSSTL